MNFTLPPRPAPTLSWSTWATFCCGRRRRRSCAPTGAARTSGAAPSTSRCPSRTAAGVTWSTGGRARARSTSPPTGESVGCLAQTSQSPNRSPRPFSNLFLHRRGTRLLREERRGGIRGPTCGRPHIYSSMNQLSSFTINDSQIAIHIFT